MYANGNPLFYFDSTGYFGESDDQASRRVASERAAAAREQSQIDADPDLALIQKRIRNQIDSATTDWNTGRIAGHLEERIQGVDKRIAASGKDDSVRDALVAERQIYQRGKDELAGSSPKARAEALGMQRLMEAQPDLTASEAKSIVDRFSGNQLRHDAPADRKAYKTLIRPELVEGLVGASMLGFDAGNAPGAGLGLRVPAPPRMSTVRQSGVGTKDGDTLGTGAKQLDQQKTVTPQQSQPVQPGNTVDERFATRPKFRKATNDDAVARSTDETGQLTCIKCDKPLTGEKQANGKRDYQLGHSDENPWVKQQDEWAAKAKMREIFTRKDVSNKYQKDVEVECVNCNAVGGAKIGNDRKK